MAKNYNETYRTLKFYETVPGENGEPATKTSTSILNEGRSDKALERAKTQAEKDGVSVDSIVTVDRMKSFIFYKAEKIEDFKELVPNEQEIVDIFNRGYTLKQNTIVQDHMDDPDWAPASEDGAFDLRAEAAVIVERRKATPEEKATKDLLKLSPEQLARVLASFKAAGQASPESEEVTA